VNERRWVLAEELGHVLLGHRLVESTEPGKPAIGLLEPRRHFYEREARAFAAEPLMLFAEVRRRWFGLSRDGVSVEDMVRRLADEFAVTTSAMRVRLSADEGCPGVKLTSAPPHSPHAVGALELCRPEEQVICTGLGRFRTSPRPVS
jgi:hypothetical protein